MRLLIVFLTALFSMGALAERYYEDEACAREKPKKITPFNNWNNTMRRWSRGKGAWDNWRDWRRPSKDEPFATFNDAMSDVTSDMMGDIVADIDFNIWVKMNFDADGWFDLDKKDKYKVYKHWKQRVEPYYDYYYEYENYYDPYFGEYGSLILA